MIKVLKEHGYEEARLGLGLSYDKTNDIDVFVYSNFNTVDTQNKMDDVMQRLAGKGGGHDKFLETIVVWLYILAPRYIWQEFDTYRVGITKQSQSTIHTLNKTEISKGLFEEMELEENQKDFQIIIEAFKRIHGRKNLHDTKVALPEGFFQGRIVCTNYKTLQNIYRQRKNHKMKWWRENLESMLNQLNYPFLIIGNKEENKVNA